MGNQNAHNWTDERTATLRKCWTEGLSASQIAKELGGVTRNAVIGKVHRICLAKRVTATRSVRPPRRERPIYKSALAPPKYLTRETPTKLKPSMNAPPSLPFLERRRDQCVAITDATRFEQKCCGHPVDGESPYCSFHRRLHTVPAKKRERSR